MKLKDDTAQTRTSGPGGAHVRWSMFGARGPLREPEKDKAGAGGGGTNEGGEGDNSNNGGGAGGGSGGGEKLITLTQAELDDRIEKRLARDRQSRSAPKPNSTANPPPKDTSNADDSDPSWIYDLHDALDDVSEETGVKPTSGAKKRLRADFQRAKPDDPHAWVKSWFTEMGLWKPTSPPPNKTAEAGKQPEQAKQGGTVTAPISDKGAASGGSRDFESINDPNELTKADYERLVAKVGVDEANKRIGEMSVRWLSTVKLRIRAA